MFKVISILVLLSGIGYYWWWSKHANVSDFKDWDFNKHQERFLHQVGITPSELSSLASTMSLGALVAEDLVGNFTDTFIAQLQPHSATVGNVYGCYQAPLDVTIKLLARGFPKSAAKLGRFFQTNNPEPDPEYDCTQAMEDVRLILAPNAKVWRALWKEHGSMVSLAKTFFPEKVYNPLEAIISYLFVTDASDDNSDQGKSE